MTLHDVDESPQRWASRREKPRKSAFGTRDIDGSAFPSTSCICRSLAHIIILTPEAWQVHRKKGYQVQNPVFKIVIELIVARGPSDWTLDTINWVNHGLRSLEWDDSHDEAAQGCLWNKERAMGSPLAGQAGIGCFNRKPRLLRTA